MNKQVCFWYTAIVLEPIYYYKIININNVLGTYLKKIRQTIIVISIM